MKRIATVVLALVALAVTPVARRERAVPFATGETLRYDVSWASFLTAGTVTTTVREKRPSFNSTAYYIVAEGRPTPLLAKLYAVYYKIDTLVDSFTLLPQRGSVYSEEGARHRFKVTQFDRGANTVRFEHTADTTLRTDFAVPAQTQDALSAIYALRTMPLKAGGRLTMPVTDEGINYQVQFDAGAPEKVLTPMGEYTAFEGQAQRARQQESGGRQEHRDLDLGKCAPSASQAGGGSPGRQLRVVAARHQVTPGPKGPGLQVS